MTGELPEHWPSINLADVTLKVGSGATPRGGSESYHDNGTPLIRSQNVHFAGFSRDGLVFLNPAQAEALKEVTVRAGDVLLNITGASIGRVTQAPPDMDGARVNQHVCIIRPKPELAPEFLSRFLASPLVQRMIWTEQYGVTRQAVTKGQILDFQIPLPPLPEQRRIVAKLEALLSKVDSCRKRLDRIPALLKRFRQAVLAAACSGRLTEDWRQQNEVADEWTTVPLVELFSMRNGKSLTASKRRGGDIPVYGGNGLMGTHNQANAQGRVIVIGRVGAQCGNVHFVVGKVWVTDNAISLESKADLVPAFYAHFLRSRNLNSLSGGTGQPYVSQEILGPIETPIVPLPEQHEIVRRVEALFTLADQIEARYAKAKAHVDKLTQSILAKAFRGELVPQDPNDEPASVMLERMRLGQTKKNSKR